MEKKQNLKAELEMVNLSDCVIKDVTGGIVSPDKGIDSIILSDSLFTGASIIASGNRKDLLIVTNGLPVVPGEK